MVIHQLKIGDRTVWDSGTIPQQTSQCVPTQWVEGKSSRLMELMEGTGRSGYSSRFSRHLICPHDLPSARPPSNIPLVTVSWWLALWQILRDLIGSISTSYVL